jgi:hypothetical protein
LGLASASDQLAEWILPGLRARMSRPRFLTAIAVSAVVCDGLQGLYAADNITPAHLVFEWLLVEGYAREGRDDEILRTPGILKAREAKRAGVRMSAKSYLKVPTVFGFHGVYKRLATNLRIVDEDYSLGDNGYALVKVWEEEQGLAGFIDSALPRQSTLNLKRVLRSAVEEGLARGYTERGGGWQGWRFFAERLAPARIGAREAHYIRQLLLDPSGDRREEVFRLLELPRNLHLADEGSEAVMIRNLLPQASPGLTTRLKAITAFEAACACVEDAFDWLRYLSTLSPARALSRSEFTSVDVVRRTASALGGRLSAAERLLDDAPSQAQEKFAELAAYFTQVRSADDLFDAVLRRHSAVQRTKPPEGKREWFEHAADGGVYVRSDYRLDVRPAPRDWWPRPYRLLTASNFCDDLNHPDGRK